MPELFRVNGYHTSLIGQAFPHSRRQDLHLRWQRRRARKAAKWSRGWGALFAYAGGKHREDGTGHSPGMDFVAERDTDLPDGQLAQAAMRQLRAMADGEQPFFLGLGFFKPHLPFVATRADWEAMQAVDMPPPKPTTSAYRHASGKFFRYQNDFDERRQPNPAQRLEVPRAYAVCVRFVDRHLGLVLDKLERLGLAENTIVVVWGDHGWRLGDPAMWGKYTPHERTLRSTLIIRAPGTLAGQSTPALTEAIDLLPTLADLAGLRDPRMRWPMDGVSQVPVLHGEASAGEDPIQNLAESQAELAAELIKFGSEAKKQEHVLIGRTPGP